MATLDVWIVKPSHRRATVPEDPDKLQLQPLGPLEEVKSILARHFHEITWTDPFAGIVDGDGWMAEISIHVGEPIEDLTLRIHGRRHGPEHALDTVRTLCSDSGWQAVDLEAWQFVV
jgi:hypothetical protein